MAKPTIVKTDQEAPTRSLRALFKKMLKWAPNGRRGPAPTADDLKLVWGAGLPGECPIASDLFVRSIEGDTLSDSVVTTACFQGNDQNGVPVRVRISVNQRYELCGIEGERATARREMLKIDGLRTERMAHFKEDIFPGPVTYEFESDRSPPRDIQDRDWDYYLVDIDDDDDEVNDLDDKIEKARAELERLEALKAQPAAKPSTLPREDR